jgi:glycine hydroxymethyltransferase
MLGAHKGFTQTHQTIADARRFGRGLEAARRLESANVIVNKNLIPEDKPQDWNYPGGLRMGTIEVTRLGMREREMEAIADLIARVLVRGEEPETVKPDALELRRGFQTLYYCFETGLPPG